MSKHILFDGSVPPRAKAAGANDLIERQLDVRLQSIEAKNQADGVAFFGPILMGVDDAIRSAIERIKERNTQNKNLVFLLTTPGGYIEVVQRIADTLRYHYELVNFIVPNFAYSAGTVLAMSGDAIYMDYYSRLGPIDPQIETRSGRMVSALGYLERYNALLKKAQANQITTAEVQVLLGFDQAELYFYEQARELSVTLLKKWLVKYKFKNWAVTRTKKRRVTRAMKEKRAAEIAMQLSNTQKWHVHGHGISKDVLEKDLNLIIDDFSTDRDQERQIREYHDLLTDYMLKAGANGAIHSVGEYRQIM